MSQPDFRYGLYSENVACHRTEYENIEYKVSELVRKFIMDVPVVACVFFMQMLFFYGIDFGIQYYYTILSWVAGCVCY